MRKVSIGNNRCTEIVKMSLRRPRIKPPDKKDTNAFGSHKNIVLFIVDTRYRKKQSGDDLSLSFYMKIYMWKVLLVVADQQQKKS